MGFEPTTAGLEGQRSAIELRPLPCSSSAWWAGEDSNLRRLCQQIYSLSPLAAREPARPLLSMIPIEALRSAAAGRRFAWC